MARPRTGKGERVVIDPLYVEELAAVNNALREWLKCRSGEPCTTVSKLQDAPIQASQGVSLDVDFEMEQL